MGDRDYYSLAMVHFWVSAEDRVFFQSKSACECFVSSNPPSHKQQEEITCPGCKETWEYIEWDIERKSDQ